MGLWEREISQWRPFSEWVNMRGEDREEEGGRRGNLRVVKKIINVSINCLSQLCTAKKNLLY